MQTTKKKERKKDIHSHIGQNAVEVKNFELSARVYNLVTNLRIVKRFFLVVCLINCKQTDSLDIFIEMFVSV